MYQLGHRKCFWLYWYDLSYMEAPQHGTGHPPWVVWWSYESLQQQSIPNSQKSWWISTKTLISLHAPENTYRCNLAFPSMTCLRYLIHRCISFKFLLVCHSRSILVFGYSFTARNARRLVQILGIFLLEKETMLGCTLIFIISHFTRDTTNISLIVH